jgi:hypothetical protein
MGFCSDYAVNVNFFIHETFIILTHFYSSSNPNQPIPIFTPAVCTLRPDNATTLRVTTGDIARWRSNPEDLVGKCFVTRDEIMKRTLLVQDYYVKRAGAQFDIIFEDTGLTSLTEAMNILDIDALLTLIKNAELITDTV